jgi:hypothetical protein
MSKVKIISDGSFAKTHVMVGDQELRCTKIKLEMEGHTLPKLTIETYVDLVDVAMLQNNTELTVINRTVETV